MMSMLICLDEFRCGLCIAQAAQFDGLLRPRVVVLQPITFLPNQLPFAERRSASAPNLTTRFEF